MLSLEIKKLSSESLSRRWDALYPYKRLWILLKFDAQLEI